MWLCSFCIIIESISLNLTLQKKQVQTINKKNIFAVILYILFVGIPPIYLIDHLHCPVWSNHLFHIAKCNRVFCSPNCQWQARGLLVEQQTHPLLSECSLATGTTLLWRNHPIMLQWAAPDACALSSCLSVADDVPFCWLERRPCDTII